MRGEKKAREEEKGREDREGEWRAKEERFAIKTYV